MASRDLSRPAATIPITKFSEKIARGSGGGGEYHKDKAHTPRVRTVFMAAPNAPLLRHIHRLMSRPDADTADDGTLLDRFVAHHHESAFAALLARHGPMVLGVCRRVLHNAHEAEDAFQATFLVLARKAGSLRRPESLAAWLYGTARHLALKYHRRDARRRQREQDSRLATSASRPLDPLDELAARELLLVLDEEMERLPETYRLPLILCGLEGRSQEEAVRLLGWTPGSFRGRLERGRARLHSRLVRRGLAFSGALLTLEVSQAGAAKATARLNAATLRAALAFARGARDGISAPILELAETGVLSMTAAKVKMGLLVLLAMSLVAGSGVMAHQALTAKQAQTPSGEGKQSAQQQPNRPAVSDNTPPGKDLYGDPLPVGAIARLGTVRFHHAGWAGGICFSPDGRTLYSGGKDSVEAWDVSSGRRHWKAAFQGPPFVLGIDLSPDGKLVAVSHSNGKDVLFLNAASGEVIRLFGESRLAGYQVLFSPDGRLLVTQDATTQTVSIWDLRKGEKIRTVESGRAFFVRSLAFSPDGKMLALPGVAEVRVCDVATGKELHRLDAYTKTAPGCVVFSSDGKLLAEASDPNRDNKDHTIRLWDTATGKQVGSLKGHTDRIQALAMSPKDNRLASASWDGTIRFWNWATRQEEGRYESLPSSFLPLAFSPDGRVLASGDNGGIIRLWHVPKGGEIRVPAERVNPLAWAGFAPNGETLISVGDRQFGLWDPLTGRPRQLFDDKPCDIPGAALSPDGKVLATSHRREKKIQLWDAATGKPLRQLAVPGYLNRWSCPFSPDGRLLAAGPSFPDLICIWDVASGKEVLQIKQQKAPSAVAFSPDGATLASASSDGSGDYTVRMWNSINGAEIWRKETRPWTAFALAFSPDGRTLALSGGLPGRQNTTGEVRLWDAATGKELRRCEGHRERVPCVLFSPDGRMLATGSQDNTIRLWEVASGQERRCLTGHQEWVNHLSFSPDGRLLVSSSRDSTALVWDLTERFRDGQFRQRHLTPEQLKRCWNDLANRDAALAYRAIVALTGSPVESVAFLKARVSPVEIADPKRVAPLLAALDSSQFAERDRAMEELVKLGLGAEPSLRKALAEKPSLEVRQRIEQVLEKLAGAPRLRALRAIEVLEHIATPEAKQVLTVIAKGTEQSEPTREAKLSLLRLDRRTTPKP
jgi:RNA polymerase sigma factor (sigma-70 family)